MAKQDMKAWEASRAFHAGRNSLPCPVVTDGFASHTGDCHGVHPRGIVLSTRATLGWYPMAAFESEM